MFTDRSMRPRLAWLSLVFAALVVACSVDTQQSPTTLTAGLPTLGSMQTGCGATEAPPGNPSGNVASSLHEGEIMGSVYLDGARECDPHVITLEPDGPTATRLYNNFEPEVTASPDYRWMWEFWDKGTIVPDGPCGHGFRSEEVGHPSPASPTSDEAHCVRPGRYTFTGGGKSFVVEYLLPTNTSVLDSTPGVPNHNDVFMAYNTGESEYGSLTGPYADLVINVDLGDEVEDTAAVLTVDTTSNPHTAAYKGGSSATAPYTKWFRFSVRGSRLSWIATDSFVPEARGRALAKLFYRNSGGGGWTALTDYYDFRPEGTYAIRKAQFAPPTCPATSRVYDVGVEMMNPTEAPAGVPDSESIQTVTVTRTCASPPPDPSSLGASLVTPSTVRISWINGTSASGTTTAVQVNDGGGWDELDGALGAGVSQYDASGLVPGTTYDVRVNHSKDGLSSSWVTESDLFATSALPSPSGLGATNVGVSTATINWTNGYTVAGTTTSVEYRVAGGSSYTTAHAALTAGTATANLTGLSGDTEYDVRVRHAFNGAVSSGAAASELFITDPNEEPPVSEFYPGTCNRRWYGNKWYIDHPVSWAVSGASGWDWQINSASSNSIGSSALFATGSSGTSTTLTGLEGVDGETFFWIRYVQGGESSEWLALAPTSLDMGSCEL